jgi:hypothetical protein
MLTIGPAITWIKVEKPTFDLVGVVLGSFKLAGVLLVVALALGVVLGGALILARRRPLPAPMDEVSLHLDG